jgi:hypothetical protein
MSIDLCAMTIDLRHVGGEVKTLPIEHIAANGSYLSIRWGQSGIYDLNLRRNVLTARSQKAQRKGSPLWSAPNIDEVRTAIAAYLKEKADAERKNLAKSIVRHAETMPGRYAR